MYDQPYVEERIDRLEALLGSYVVSTNTAIKSVSRDVSNLSREMKEFKDEMKEYKTTSEQRSKEADQRMDDFKQEMKAEHRKMNKQWGDLANKMGTIVEDIVAPAVRPVVNKYFHDEILHFAVNTRRKNKELNLKGEFDVIAVTADKVFLVETKSSPNKEKLDEFILNIEKFKKLFPEYADKKLIPFFASLRFDEDLIEQTTQKNIYCLAYREWDYMDILNFDKVSV